MSIANNEDALLTLREAATITKMSLAWWQRAARGEFALPPVRVIRIGRNVRIHGGDLRAWINGEVTTSPRRRGRPTKEEQIARERQVLRKE